MKKTIILAFALLLCSLLCACSNSKYSEAKDFLENNDYFVYTEVSAGDYALSDICVPGDAPFAMVYSSNENSEDTELAYAETQLLLSCMESTGYTPVPRDDCYSLGLLKDSSDGKFKNMLAINPDISFSNTESYPKNIFGEYVGVYIDIIRLDENVYLHFLCSSGAGEWSSNGVSVFRANDPVELFDYIEELRRTYG